MVTRALCFKCVAPLFLLIRAANDLLILKHVYAKWSKHDSVVESLWKFQTPKDFRKICSWNTYISIMRIWKKSAFFFAISTILIGHRMKINEEKNFAWYEIHSFRNETQHCNFWIFKVQFILNMVNPNNILKRKTIVIILSF